MISVFCGILLIAPVSILFLASLSRSESLVVVIAFSALYILSIQLTRVGLDGILLGLCAYIAVLVTFLANLEQSYRWTRSMKYFLSFPLFEFLYFSIVSMYSYCATKCSRPFICGISTYNDPRSSLHTLYIHIPVHSTSGVLANFVHVKFSMSGRTAPTETPVQLDWRCRQLDIQLWWGKPHSTSVMLSFWLFIQDVKEAYVNRYRLTIAHPMTRICQKQPLRGFRLSRYD